MTSEFSIAAFVRGRIRELLRGGPDALTPSGRAALAHLRRAVTEPPGTVPAIWPITSEGLPDVQVVPGSAVPRSKAPRSEQDLDRIEEAVHLALTQFAAHQQSQPVSMHDDAEPFGRAIRRLAVTQAPSGENSWDAVYETPAYRRFTALALARDHNAFLAHSRGLISQLRANSIPFDYGAFAEDIYWLTSPRGADHVRQRWGRDFTRPLREATDTDTTTPSSDDTPAGEHR